MADAQWNGLKARLGDKPWTPMPTVAEMQSMMKSMPGAGMTIIITCADPRADPTHYLSINPGEAPILRNAGGRVTKNLLTSLELMSAVGKINMLVVIHHTECGGLHVTDEDIRKSLSERAPEHASALAKKEWYSYKSIGMDQSIRDDIAALKSWDFYSEDIPIRGYAFDIKSGQLREII